MLTRGKFWSQEERGGWEPNPGAFWRQHEPSFSYPTVLMEAGCDNLEWSKWEVMWNACWTRQKLYWMNLIVVWFLKFMYYIYSNELMMMCIFWYFSAVYYFNVNSSSVEMQIFKQYRLKWSLVDIKDMQIFVQLIFYNLEYIMLILLHWFWQLDHWERVWVFVIIKTNPAEQAGIPFELLHSK